MPSYKESKGFSKRSVANKFNKRAKRYLPSPSKLLSKYTDEKHTFQILYKKGLHTCHVDACLCKQKANRHLEPELAESLFNHSCSSAHHRKCQVLHG